MPKKAKKTRAKSREATKKKSVTESNRGKRYSKGRKLALLSKYRELRKKGMTAQKAAKAVKVSYLTLRKWEKETGAPKLGRAGSGKAGKKGRSAATTHGKRGGLTLITPAGFRIEGISSKELIQVLKAIK
jgi:DNA-binding XRE family transcriptional regulator